MFRSLVIETIILIVVIVMPVSGFADSTTKGIRTDRSPADSVLTDRALVAVCSDGGVFLSWRMLPGDLDEVSFIVYRDNHPVATVTSAEGTNYFDRAGTAANVYRVDTASPDTASPDTASPDTASPDTASPDTAGVTCSDVKPWSAGFLTLKLRRPEPQLLPDGQLCTFTPNDCSAADLDGDGLFELIVKWDPSASHDNAHSGYTGTTFLDAYRLDGTFLWRINLGINIRSGAHYSPFLVGNFDRSNLGNTKGNRRAELIVKTADGTIDGLGRVIGSSTADYRTPNGYVLDGPEYLTVFDGLTGAAISTVDYFAPRTIRQQARYGAEAWGDNYGNRQDRFLACAAALDGKHYSAVMCRGYYTAAYLGAYDFDGKQLSLRWFHRSEKPGEGLYGQGNHNLAVGDLDGDGKDEIVYGAAAVDDDGQLFYRTGFGHGDALHLFGTRDTSGNTDNTGDLSVLRLWCVHEDRSSPYGAELRTGSGKVLWGHAAGRDIGRGIAADIDGRYPGHELFSPANRNLCSITGEPIAQTGIPVNFRIYWDGDLLDELLDGTMIFKWDGQHVQRMTDFAQFNHSRSINGTKRNPCLSADILGDWREEVIYYNADKPDEINIFTTTIQTEHRIDCLMTDHVYRMSIIWQNTGYNQPPHTGVYLPDRVRNRTGR